MNLEHLKPYIPAGLSFLMGLMVLWLPGLAVFLVVGGLFTFGVLYAFVVYKLREAVQRQTGSAAFEDAGSETMEPNFKNVTVYMVKKGNFFEPDSTQGPF